MTKCFWFVDSEIACVQSFLEWERFTESNKDRQESNKRFTKSNEIFVELNETFTEPNEKFAESNSFK